MEEIWLKRVSESRLSGSFPRNCPMSSRACNSRRLDWYRCRIPVGGREVNACSPFPLALFPFFCSWFVLTNDLLLL